MWKVIEEGDVEREKKHLPIDGAADRENEPGTVGELSFWSSKSWRL